MELPTVLNEGLNLATFDRTKVVSTATLICIVDDNLGRCLLRRVSLDEGIQLYAWHGHHHTAHITGLRDREGW